MSGNNTRKKYDIQTVNGFSSVLKNYERSIAQLLQTKYGISADEFYVTCVNAVKKNPKLLNCDPRSLFGAILLSAEVGLRPNTPDQHAFIIPYKGEAKFQIGYKGLIEMMYRNPRVKSITAEAVFEKDVFEYGYGLEPYLKHSPHRGSDRGKLVATYAVCKLKDADPIFTVVESHQLEEIKQFSASKGSNFSPYTSGADVHHFMEIKASIKKLSKLIPKQGVAEIARAVEYDSKFEGGASVTVPLLSDGEQEVLPKLMEGAKSNSLEGAFDIAVNLPEEKEKIAPVASKEIKKEEPVPVKKEVNKESLESSFDNEVDFSTIGEVIKPLPEENVDIKYYAEPVKEEVEEVVDEPVEQSENNDNNIFTTEEEEKNKKEESNGTLF